MVPKSRTGRSKAARAQATTREIERVQTGVRLEKRMLSVLKALADAKNLSLGDLVEGIVLHAFEGRAPFSPSTLDQIAALKRVFGLTLTAADSHALVEQPSGRRKGTS